MATATVQTIEHQQPQQQRTLVPAPDGGNAVLQRQREFEFVATYSTEKSFCTKAAVRQPKASITNRHCVCAAGRANAIQSARLRAAPAIGRLPCTSATASANTRGQLSEFGNHFAPPTTVLAIFSLASAPRLSASAASGGM